MGEEDDNSECESEGEREAPRFYSICFRERGEKMSSFSNFCRFSRDMNVIIAVNAGGVLGIRLFADEGYLYFMVLDFYHHNWD